MVEDTRYIPSCCCSVAVLFARRFHCVFDLLHSIAAPLDGSTVAIDSALTQPCSVGVHVCRERCFYDSRRGHC